MPSYNERRKVRDPSGFPCMPSVITSHAFSSGPPSLRGVADAQAHLGAKVEVLASPDRVDVGALRVTFVNVVELHTKGPDLSIAERRAEAEPGGDIPARDVGRIGRGVALTDEVDRRLDP